MGEDRWREFLSGHNELVAWRHLKKNTYYLPLKLNILSPISFIRPQVLSVVQSTAFLEATQ